MLSADKARRSRGRSSLGHHESWTRQEDVRAPSERSFGITFAVVFARLAGWAGLRQGLAAVPALLGLLAAGFLIAAFRVPTSLSSLNRLWFRFGLVLHAVVNPLVLGLLFYLVLTPTGLVMRLVGKDFLGLRRAGPSYWVKRNPQDDKTGTMINQF